MTPDTNGWSHAELHVTEELKRLSSQLEKIDEKLTRLRIDVAQKGAIWGAVSGAIVAVGAWMLRR